MFVTEVEIDNEIRSGNHTGVALARNRPQSRKSNVPSTVQEQDESTALLGDEPHNENEEPDGPEWFGYSELAGLPWYNRPSVCIMYTL